MSHWVRGVLRAATILLMACALPGCQNNGGSTSTGPTQPAAPPSVDGSNPFSGYWDQIDRFQVPASSRAGLPAQSGLVMAIYIHNNGETLFTIVYQDAGVALNLYETVTGIVTSSGAFNGTGAGKSGRGPFTMTGQLTSNPDRVTGAAQFRFTFTQHWGASSSDVGPFTGTAKFYGRLAD